MGVTYPGGARSHKHDVSSRAYRYGVAEPAEHGGFAIDDRHVALLVSGPGLLPLTVPFAVDTTQVAPTILGALGLDPRQLQAVRQEGTSQLPGLLFI